MNPSASFYKISADEEALARVVWQLWKNLKQPKETKAFREFSYDLIYVQCLSRGIPLFDVPFYIHLLKEDGYRSESLKAIAKDEYKSIFANKKMLFSFFSDCISSLISAPLDVYSLKVSQVAESLQLSHQTALSLISSGELPAFRIGTHFRVFASDLRAFIFANKLRPSQNMPRPAQKKDDSLPKNEPVKKETPKQSPNLQKTQKPAQEQQKTKPQKETKKKQDKPKKTANPATNAKKSSSSLSSPTKKPSSQSSPKKALHLSATLIDPPSPPSPEVISIDATKTETILNNPSYKKNPSPKQDKSHITETISTPSSTFSLPNSSSAEMFPKLQTETEKLLDKLSEELKFPEEKSATPPSEELPSIPLVVNNSNDSSENPANSQEISNEISDNPSHNENDIPPAPYVESDAEEEKLSASLAGIEDLPEIKPSEESNVSEKATEGEPPAKLEETPPLPEYPELAPKEVILPQKPEMPRFEEDDEEPAPLGEIPEEYLAPSSLSPRFNRLQEDSEEGNEEDIADASSDAPEGGANSDIIYLGASSAPPVSAPPLDPTLPYLNENSPSDTIKEEKGKTRKLKVNYLGQD